jgi:hypothetical protein
MRLTKWSRRTRSSQNVRLRLLNVMLLLSLMAFPLRSLSEQPQPDLKLSHAETTNLGNFIADCHVNKKLLDSTDRLLTDCEFRNKCRTMWTPLLSGLLIGAASAYIIENERRR